MLYVRGHRWDYDHWAALGNPGWSYDEVLPYFRQSEHNENLSGDYHGQGGPLNVMNLRSPGKLNEPFMQACEQAGIPRTADYNGAEQFGSFEYQVTHINGERCSTRTPTARMPSNRTLSVWVCVITVRLGRDRFGVRKALAALQRSPLM